MNGFFIALAILLAAPLASPALAQTPPPQTSPPQTSPPQTSPPAGSLHQPTPAERAVAAEPAKPPAAAPRKPVHKAAPRKTEKPSPPAKSVLGRSAPGKTVKRTAKATPVVSAPANAHAQKPPPALAAAPARPAVPAKEAPKAAAPVAAAPPPAPAPAAPVLAESPKGGVTGLPLPRWVSLKADDVNMRAGPGTRYPIDWVYHRVNLPVQIEREFEVWRLIEDEDGVKGWVHEATLTGRRSFVVKGGEQVLRRSASDSAAAVARLKPGVIGRLRACDGKAEWCEVQVNDYRGYLKRADIYGLYPGEAVN